MKHPKSPNANGGVDPRPERKRQDKQEEKRLQAWLDRVEQTRPEHEPYRHDDDVINHLEQL